MAALNRLGFGCVALSTLASARASRSLLEGVFELGLRHFDTAPIYGQGYSERLVGEFLRDKRDQVSVATKFGLAPRRAPRLPVGLAMGLNALRRLARRSSARPSNAPPTPSAAPPPAAEAASPRRIGRAEVQASFDASRRSLGTDYVDLYLLHEHLPSSLEPATLDFLLELRASGRVRKLGLAANGTRYLGLAPADLAEWDVLQYEFGPSWPGHADLLKLFPTKTHIFHSCLMDIAQTGQTAGQVLARCLSANPAGRVLFSSTKIAHVRDNLQLLGS